MHNYWLVRAKWEGIYDKTSQFIENDEWINGYNDKYFDIVNRVKINDILLLADASNILYFAVCIENAKDGKHIQVGKWRKFDKSIYFQAKGAYVKTISNIHDKNLIDEAKSSINKILEQESLYIKFIKLTNFTLFKEQQFDFNSGLNILIGENSTGKSQLMKLLYSIIKSNNTLMDSTSKDKDRYSLQTIIPQKLLSILRPDNLQSIISDNEKQCYVNFGFDKYNIKFNFTKTTKIEVNINKEDVAKNFFEKKALFIPAKEILSFFEGFSSIYPNTSFDETFYDLAISLGKIIPSTTQDSLYKSIIDILENTLNGKIVLQNGRFYLEIGTKKTEISMIAEGLRKIGTLSYLIANGTLDNNTILFWDEPESNLNPKYIKFIAKVLLELEQKGVQIFISTHSLFLVKEIEILRKRENNIKYFAIGFNDNKGIIVFQDTELEKLQNLVFLDEELNQNDRFMDKDYVDS